MVIVWPCLMSPCLTFQSRSPVSASSATVCASSWLKNILPSAYAAPRFTTSQQAIGIASSLCVGWNFHLIGVPGWLRSRAYTMLGNGVTTYMVSPTTSGVPSWPRSTPVENVQATSRFLTFSAEIRSSGL